VTCSIGRLPDESSRATIRDRGEPSKTVNHLVEVSAIQMRNPESDDVNSEAPRWPAALEEPNAMLAHELRNPIGAIRHAVTLMDSAGQHRGVMEQPRRIIARQVGQLSVLPLQAIEVSHESPSSMKWDERPQAAVAALARPSGGLAGWQLKRVLDYIKANLAEPMKVTDLASVARLSTSHFSRAFKQSVGMPVHLYLIHRRVERAQQLISSTQEPLRDIAQSCGMHDQAHLTRWFRRVLGDTPGSWRRTPYSGVTLTDQPRVQRSPPVLSGQCSSDAKHDTTFTVSTRSA
jgi:AraC-like DNA-binding protein